MLSCRICGVEFHRKRANGRTPVTCYNEGCQKEWNRRRIARIRGVTSDEYSCRWCGSVWVNIRGGSRSQFCSAEHKNEWEKADKRRSYEKHPQTGEVAACAECASVFVRVQPNQVVCSARCRRRRNGRLRSLNRGTWAPSESLRERVWVRDGGLCQLCGDPVPNLPRYDGAGKIPDEYPTLDHILPRSRGGSNDYENLQLAHWKCNVLKGASVVSVLSKAG